MSNGFLVRDLGVRGFLVEDLRMREGIRKLKVKN